MTRSVPELLAPAGTPEALEAACAAGADAVYLGASRFGARAAAGFDERALDAAVEFAHARDVRVYVTVNTLVAEKELASAADELLHVYSAGADAILVQDPGVASLARELVPDLPLHASTQLTVHSADGVRAAAALGCSRVVLARELNLAEVEAIAAEVPEVELEVFAHGALCYGWSGQCLLSSAIGGRSGNRGRCAQPCRKPYRLLRGRADDWGRLVDPKTVPLTDRYLLSPHDLRTYPELARLVAAPIAALKIEGRLRSPAYVGAVVGCYRQALDLAAAGEFSPESAALEALGLAFNRGFTRGRLFGATDADLMGRDRPGPRGLRIGTVLGTDRTGRTGVRLEGAVRPERGDGLVVAPLGRPEADVGTVLRHPVEGDLLTLALGAPVPAGAPVYLTSRAPPPSHAPDTRVELGLRLRVGDDGRPVAEGEVRRRHGSTVPFEAVGEPFAPARSRPLTAEVVEEHLRRTGGTPYHFAEIAVDLPRDYFAPASALNDLRRRVLAAAAATLIGAGRPEPGSVRAATERRRALVFPTSGTVAECTLRIRALVDSVEAAGAAARAGADEVCLEPSGSPAATCACTALDSGVVVALLRRAAEACGGVPPIWKWPRITRQAFLDRALAILQDVPVAGVLVDGLGAARAVASTVPGLPVHGGPGLNLWNSRAAAVLSACCATLALSPELSLAELSAAIGASHVSGLETPFAVQVQGSLEVMVTEDCVPALAGCPPPPGTRFALEDETGRLFPVLPDAGGCTRFLNAAETCLIDHLPALAGAGVEVFTIDARGRTPVYVGVAVEAYRLGIDALDLPEPGRSRRLEALKSRLVPIAAGGITAGPLVRGRQEE